MLLLVFEVSEGNRGITWGDQREAWEFEKKDEREGDGKNMIKKFKLFSFGKF